MTTHRLLKVRPVSRVSGADQVYEALMLPEVEAATWVKLGIGVLVESPSESETP
jgi:hypothetical protein